MMRYPQSGFTLIEMVVTIVLIGIIGVGMSRFIGQSVQGVKDTAERQQMSTIGWITSEKLSRELRTALPNSIRLNAGNTCIEFIPTVEGTYYLSEPVVDPADNSIEVVAFPDYTGPDGQDHRVAVYPYTLGDLYDEGNPGTISNSIDSIAAGDPGKQKITLSSLPSSPHQFLNDSPTRRLYIVSQPVMYCFVGQYLYRYGNYGFQSTMPTPASGAVIATQLARQLNPDLSERDPFEYAPGTLSRSGVVKFVFRVQGDGAEQLIDQEVQIRNVP